MKKLIILLLVLLLVSFQVACKSKKETGGSMKEVVIENESNYIFKKIYVEDKLGRTHEILTSSSGSTLGGVGMIELCVYREK